MEESTKERAYSLLEFLRQIINLNSAHANSYREYKNYLFFADVPKEKGCFTQAWGLSEESPDIWLEIRKINEPLLPDYPEVCEPWIKQDTVYQSDDLPALYESISETNTEEIEGQDVVQVNTIYLKDRPDVEELWNKYLDTDWLPWQDKHLRWKKVYTVYKKLFEIYLELEQLGEQYELIMGVGLLKWQLPDGRLIERHLLTTKATLEFDEQTGSFTLQANDQDEKIYLEFDALDQYQPLMKNTVIADLIKQAEENPWDRAIIDGILGGLANVLGTEGSGTYSIDIGMPEIPITNKPIVMYAPAIILRKRSLQAIDHYLDEIQKSVENNETLPEWMCDIFESKRTKEETQERENAHYQERLPENRIYFPLPFNEQQKSIIDKLEHSSGILVQGPPGTGKSHTIANLICHLLATGQRILITAKAPRALQVLHGMLPKDIQKLCVSMIGQGQEESQSLKNSVAQIQINESEWNPQETQKIIEVLENRLDQKKRQKADADYSIKLIREKDTLLLSIVSDQYKGTPTEIAKQVSDEEKLYEWFYDESASIENNIELQNELIDIQKGLASFDKTTKIAIAQRTIDLEILSTPQELETLINEERQLIEGIKRTNIQRTNENEALFETDIENIRMLSESLNVYLLLMGEVLKRPCKWIPNAVNEILSDLDTPWRELQKITAATLKAIKSNPIINENSNIDNKALVPEELLLEDLRVLLEYTSNGGKVGLWFLKPQIKRLKYLKDVKYNGRPCLNTDTIKKAIAYFELKRGIELLWNLWKGKIEKVDDAYPIQIGYIEEGMEGLNDCLEMYEKKLYIKEVLQNITAFNMPSWLDQEKIQRIVKTCQHLLYQSKLTHTQCTILKIIKILDQCEVAQGYHPIHDKLKDSINARNLREYTVHYTSFQLIKKQQNDYQGMRDKANKLKAQIPNLIEDILNKPYEKEWAERLSILNKAYHWRQAKLWIEKYLSEDDIAEIQKKISKLGEEISGTIGQLAARKAWAFCLSRMTDEQSKALRLFSGVRIPKSGKTLLRKRREAQIYLNDCKSAIPAWIMPLHRVYETVKPVCNTFDVVIVDEASQCGQEGIPLFYLGKKIIIVGDDKQISPTAVFIQDDSIQRLKKQYLGDFKYPEQFDPRQSLYDQAFKRFPLRYQIRLREHFRCMPEIIRFSNNHFYSDNPLIPLKRYTAKRLEPLKIKHITEGYREGKESKVTNKPEAEAIVQEIKYCCADDKYEGKTMGVITLQGHSQDKLIESMLIEEIGIEEMKNRELICGDPYSFQGDERDIIFLSMVAAPNERVGVLVGEDYERRYNVAASRAKEQMWLFHSVTVSDVGQNCLRRKLLNHFSDKMGSEQATINKEKLLQDIYNISRNRENVPSPFDSWFEVDVFMDLANRGYFIFPQYEIAKRYIDLLVEGYNGIQLAVECYGDYYHGIEQYEKDMSRQRQLERCGLVFHIIRECEYYSNRTKTIEKLIKKLESMGIKPIQYECKETINEDIIGKDGIIENNIPETITINEETIGLANVQEAMDLSLDKLSYEITEILSNRPNCSCIRDQVATLLLKKWKIVTRGNPREKFIRKVDKALRALEKKDKIELYKAKNTRVRLKNQAKQIWSKAIYRHKRSGDYFGIETDEAGVVVGTCGPLFGSGFDPKMLDYDDYWNREVAAKLGEFERVSEADYAALLRKNGFVVQSSQRWLWGG